MSKLEDFGYREPRITTTTREDFAFASYMHVWNDLLAGVSRMVVFRPRRDISRRIQSAERAMSRMEWSEAIQLWQTILNDYGNEAPPSVYRKLSRAYCRCGNFDEAEANIHLAMSKHPKDIRLKMDYAETAMSRKDWGVAVERWRALIKGNEAVPIDVYVQLSRAYRRFGAFSEAEAVIESALKEFNGDISLMMEYAEIALDLLDLDAALVRYQVILESADAPPSVYVELSRLYRLKGYDQLASETSSRGIAKFPSHIELSIHEVISSTLNSSQHDIDKGSKNLLDLLDWIDIADKSTVNSFINAIDVIAEKDADSAAIVRDGLAHKMFADLGDIAERLDSEPKKIAYIASSPIPTPAASCVQMLSMSSAFASVGCICNLLYSKNPNAEFSNETLSQYGLPTNFFHCVVNSSGDFGIESVRQALKWGATHVYTRNLRAAYFACLAGIPTLLELHKPIPTQELAIARDASKMKALLGIIAITSALKADLAGIFSRIEVMPDASHLPGKKVVPFPLRKRCHSIEIGYVGHLYPGKGLELITKLAEIMPGVGFHIFGGDENQLKWWTNQCANQKNVIFYGYHTHNQVPSILSAVDVAIAPYGPVVMARGNKYDIAAYMSPLKLFEYMANSKAIISSDLPAIREVLEHNRNAILCDPNNVDDWVNGIQRLTECPSLRIRLGAEARNDVEKNFTWEKRARKILALL